MSNVDNEALDKFFDLEQAIYDHVGYVPQWRVFPIMDSREEFWAVDPTERQWLKHSPKREALEYWLADHDDEYGPHGDCLYRSCIYTQRHHQKWVWRGALYTLVLVDTQTDGNVWLELVSNDREVKS